MGQTEERMPLFEYPPFDFSVTDEITNLDLGEEGVDPVATSPGGPID
jgi:hypothetical protein